MTDEQYADHASLAFKAIVIASIALLPVMAIMGSRPDATLDPADFAGCYRAKQSVVTLSKDGIFHTAQGDWPFRILAPVGGKHGDLIEVLGMAAEQGQRGPIFRRRGAGYMIDIQKGKAFWLYVSEKDESALVPFIKGDCA